MADSQQVNIAYSAALLGFSSVILLAEAQKVLKRKKRKKRKTWMHNWLDRRDVEGTAN